MYSVVSALRSVPGAVLTGFFQWMQKEYGFTPRWNFYKVLLDPKGNLVETYNSITKPTSPKITSKIEQYLNKDS